MRRLALALALAAVAGLAFRAAPTRGARTRAPSPRAAASADWARFLAARIESTDAGVERVALVPLGGGDAGMPLPAPEPLAATGLLGEAVAAALCPQAVRLVCGAREGLGCGGPVLPLDAEEAMSCEDHVAAQCARWAHVTYGGEPDLARISDVAVARCLDRIEHEIFHGAAELALDLECTDLMFDPARPGERCLVGGACDGGICAQDLCVSWPRAGEPCDVAPCDRGLHCIAGLCAPPVPLGAPCDDESVCAEDGLCEEGRCTSYPDDDFCTWPNDCDLGEVCADSRCTPGPRRCLFGTECGRGRTCVGTWSARCLSPGAAPGGPTPQRCTDDGICPVDLTCSFVTTDGRCRPWVCGDLDVFTIGTHSIEDCH